MFQKEKKYPWFQMFSQSVLTTTDSFRSFLKFGGIMAAILTVFAFVCGQSFICLTPLGKSQSYCVNNLFVYVSYIFFKSFIISVFLRIWIDAVFLKKDINKSYFKSGFTNFFKFFGILLIFFAVNTLPMLSLSMLIARKPNPVWQIEILYFSFVSLGFIIPFFLLRFYANIALLIEGLPCFDFKQTYLKTNFQSSGIFTAFSLVLAFCLFVFIIVYSNLKIHTFEPLYLYNIFSEYLFEFVILVIASVILNFVMLQKNILQ